MLAGPRTGRVITWGAAMVISDPAGPMTEYCRLGGHSTCTSPACTCRLGTHVMWHEHGDSSPAPTRQLRLRRRPPKPSARHLRAVLALLAALALGACTVAASPTAVQQQRRSTCNFLQDGTGSKIGKGSALSAK